MGERMKVTLTNLHK